MKTVIIVHGWDGTPEEGWFPWLKAELEKNGFVVRVPQLPETGSPRISKWVPALAAAVGVPDTQTYFVGHSIGCQAIMRYVEKLNKDELVGGIIFVAGWFNLTDEAWDETYTKKIAAPWLNTNIDFNKIKEHTNKIVDFYSEDDLYVPVTDAVLFKERLNAKIVSVGNKKHINEEDGVTEVPFVVDELMRMVRKN